LVGSDERQKQKRWGREKAVLGSGVVVFPKLIVAQTKTSLTTPICVIDGAVRPVQFVAWDFAS
jgi:hypothetical protein